MSEPEDARPRRVWVVGSPAAGKSAFGRALAARLGVEHVEIDALYHGPGWTPAPAESVRARLSERMAADGWVVDGNYGSTVGDLVRDAADTVVWLDLSRGAVMRSVVARSLVRVVRGTELWNGNRERWRNLFDPRPRENIVLWTWTQFGAYRRRYAAAVASARPGQTWHRFPTRASAWAWLESLPPRA